LIPSRPRGIVAERDYTEADCRRRPPAQRRGMLHLRHAFRTRPHFVAWWVDELPAAAPWIARNIFGCRAADLDGAHARTARIAARHADQMIFERFGRKPDAPAALEVADTMHNL